MKETEPSTAFLFDQVIEILKLKNDRALAQRLGQSAPSISKMRGNRYPLSSEAIISIHEETQLPIYAIRSLAGIIHIEQPDRDFYEMIRKSRNYKIIKSAGFCFCIESNECCEYNQIEYFYFVAIAQCTGYRPTPGEFYTATKFELEEMNESGIEVSSQHFIVNLHFPSAAWKDWHANTMMEIDEATSNMIAECPHFYAIKAEYEGDLIAAMIAQQPAQQTTKPQRGRL